MKYDSSNDNDTLMNIKNKKIVLYLTKQVIQLNYSCNNVIGMEKFQRAITMFTSMNEDFETIKNIIDWHVENERKQYIEYLKRKRYFEKAKNNNYKESLNKQQPQDHLIDTAHRNISNLFQNEKADQQIKTKHR